MRTYNIAFIFLLILGNSAFAGEKIVDIFESEVGEGRQEIAKLYLSSGEIVSIPMGETELYEKSKRALHENLEINLIKISNNPDSADYISGLELLEKSKTDDFVNIRSSHKEMFRPTRVNALKFSTKNPFEKSNLTLLSSYGQAQSIMNKMNRKTRDRSQCYNRAHMWTYETLVNSNSEINLGKIWIFFTSKYIKKFNYKWWFHVAPIASVADSNATYVLDKGFTSVPFNVFNWKNIFMKNKANCPVVTDYFDYRNNQKSAYCYLIKSSQYYWQPHQLKNLSKKNMVTWGYKKNNLKIAYKDALISWNRTIPILVERALADVNSEEISSRDDSVETPRDNSGATRIEVVRRNPRINSVLSIGSGILDLSDNDIGQVVELLAGGRVRYRSDSDNKIYTRSRKDISLEVKCFEEICKGMSILDNSDQDTGVIVNVFANGMARYKSNRYEKYYIRVVSDLSLKINCLDDICVDSNVLDTTDNDSGKILALYNNGKATYISDTYGLRYTRLISELSVEVKCLKNICKDDDIIDTTDGDTGFVYAIYSNGKAKYRSSSDGALYLRDLVALKLK